jgi:hypothetical protein
VHFTAGLNPTVWQKLKTNRQLPRKHQTHRTPDNRKRVSDFTAA